MQRFTRRALVQILFVACAGLLPSNAHPQSLQVARAGISRPLDVLESTANRRGPSLAAATLASAIVPGAGQALLRSGRAFIYAGIETLGWIRYSRQQSDGDKFRRRYRELSRTVARAAFNPSGPDGDWDYYERMEKFAASGAYDRVPGGDVDPESDASTYNGSIWLLARQTYWRDPDTSPAPSSPEFQSAIAFYAKRAVPSDLRWSWVGAAEGFQQYRRSVAASNTAFKRAEQTAGLIIANHILSAVDAYVAVRMRLSNDPRGDTMLSFTAQMPGTH
jgi:hypothetical protein